MGAEAIYIHSSPQTVNDIIFPKNSVLQYTMNGLTVSSKNGYFNPLEHWGCNYTHLYPQQVKGHSYKLCTGLMTSIQAESKYLHVQSKEASEENIVVSESCDTSSPDVVMSSGTYAFFHVENILYMRDAFWGLPTTEVNDSSDAMCFSFLIQKLLWFTGRRLLLHTGRSLHTLKDVDTSKIQICRTFLDGINCEMPNFTACFAKLCDSFPADVLNNKHVLKFQMKWLKALEVNDYQLPNIHPETQNKCDPKELIYTPVQHKVSYRIKKWRVNPFPPVNNIAAIRTTYTNMCEGADKKFSSIQPDFLAPWIIWEDVLLVVVFNIPLYDIIPYIEVLYRSFFPHVLYCGPSMLEYVNFTKLRSYNISFVAYGATPVGHFLGSFNYKCLMMAVEMKYDVRGYLVVADDLLFIPQKIKQLNLEKAWFPAGNHMKTADIKTLRECRLGMCDFHTHWRWWVEYQDAVLKTLQDMESRRNESLLINKCLKTLSNLNHSEFHVNGGYSDIFYIPHYLGDSFAQLLALFHEHNVFLEIAIPTVFRCLVPDTEMEILQGKQVWDKSRNEPWVYFTKNDLAYKSFLHPVKWSYLDKGSNEHKSLFCSVVSYLYDPYGRMNKILTS